MELNYDWRAFQSMFYPKRRSLVNLSREMNGPIYLVVDSDVIVTAFGEGEDLARWTGAHYQEMATDFPHRELMVFERKEVDQWVNSSTALTHFYDQIESLRTQAAPKVVSRSRFKQNQVKLKSTKELHVDRHFLLEALQGWWSKLLPSSYGVFIRLEGNVKQDFFMIVRRGKIGAFHEPDLYSLGTSRAQQPKEVVRYLSEKHLVPVQGLTVPASEWSEWQLAPNPWRKAVQAVRNNTAKLFPFRWGLMFLGTLRSWFGL